jgi:hypothetical protein
MFYAEVFIIRLLSGRSKTVERINSQLRDSGTKAAYQLLRQTLRSAREECNTPNRITKLKGGVYEIELQVTPLGASYETRTYMIFERNGETVVRRQN